MKKLFGVFAGIQKYYAKLPGVGKLAVILGLFLVAISLCKHSKKREGMVGDNSDTAFTYKRDTDVFDNFYVGIYDDLVYNRIKNDYEVGTIINSTSPTSRSIIADIGCGTGHHVNELSAQGLRVTGVDISPAMIAKARTEFPDIAGNFMTGNAMNHGLFPPHSLTHILCLYFTLYYMENKSAFFANCMDWLMPGGYLIVHLVDKHRFDPILPPGNPLYIVSPQKYAKNRITNTKITFNNFVYESNFDLPPSGDVATFEEKFRFNNGKTRKHEQRLYMDDIETIVNLAQQAGFLVHAKVDMVKCAYENQYLYVFVKP